jgi:hypothetical protein
MANHNAGLDAKEERGEVLRMSLAHHCGCPSPSPALVPVPGTEGAQGVATNGRDAFTTTSAGHSSPSGPFNRGDSVTFPVADASWASIGQHIFVQGAGYFLVTSLSGNNIAATFINVPANANGSVVVGGSVVCPAGAPYGIGALPSPLNHAALAVTAATTLAAGVGIYTLSFAATLPTGTSAADRLMGFVPGHKFRILSFAYVVQVATAGTGAARDWNLEISGVGVGSPVVTLPITIGNSATVGAVVNSASISNANTGSAADTISLKVASGGTAYTAGSGTFILRIQNLDTAEAVKGLASHINHLISTTLS